MDMLTKKDLSLIGAEVAKVIEDNVNPRFEAIETRLDRVEGRLDKIEGRVGKIETTMVTKSYLDDKLADLRGGLIANQKKLEHRLDRHIEGASREELESLRLFPR